MSGSEFEDDEVEDEDGLDDEAAADLGAKMPSRASLAMMADAEAIAQVTPATAKKWSRVAQYILAVSCLWCNT